MDSNKKIRSEQTRTPLQLNASVYHFKTSARKRFSPNVSQRPNLNETTVCSIGGPSSIDCKIKTKLSTCYTVNYETEVDIAYNGYLQALLKRQLVENKINEHKYTLEEQILVQNDNLYKRNKKYEEIVTDTEMLKKQGEIIEMINFFQENLENIKNVYLKHDMKRQLREFQDKLNSECENVLLKHIKTIRNQKEYDEFIDSLQQCLSIMQKIVNSGRDFDQIHRLAEKMREFMKLKATTHNLQLIVSKLEKEAAYTLLRNMSDFFAINYNEMIAQ